MNGGEGAHSYIQNSSYQRGVLDIAKQIIKEIFTKQDVKQLSTFLIADFGCSTGHNSFPIIETITNAITKKLLESTELPKSAKITVEFLVFFNDVIKNDFNTLFRSLPQNRSYHATGLPGDFHGILLPKSSLHFAYCSWSLHWLKEVPKEVVDPTSPAWNQGFIGWTGNEMVRDVYVNQHAKDTLSFLNARAHEMVGGGLIALLIPVVPKYWDPITEYTLTTSIDLLGFCLKCLVNKGKISKSKLDQFNVPYYFNTQEELESVVKKCLGFTVEKMEILDHPGKHTFLGVNDWIGIQRAVHERMLTEHFGNEIIDELFDHYYRKNISSIMLDTNNDRTSVMLLILKRINRSTS